MDSSRAGPVSTDNLRSAAAKKTPLQIISQVNLSREAVAYLLSYSPASVS